MQWQRVGGLSLVAAAVAVSVYAGQTQDPAAKAASILAEARKAIGGEDKIAAIKTLEIKGTARRGATDVNLEGDFTISLQLPDKYLRKESIVLGSAGIDITEGLNGQEAWEEQKFGGNMNFGDDGGNRGGGFRGGGVPGSQQAATPAATPEEAEAAKQKLLLAKQTEVARIILSTLLSTNRPVKWTGTAVSPQATAEVIEMEAPDGQPVRVLIDSKTYLPLMLTWTGIPQDPIASLAARSGWRGRGGRGGRGFYPGGNSSGNRGNQQGSASQTAARADALAQPTALRMFLSEYKVVNGINLPHLLVRGAGDQVTEEWVVKSYKINPNLKADTFKKQQ
jgi:hypothetical protein